ncbi:4-(cytidine 5'-diphospho)-2-C-methyl-D-erythritol kinase [Kaistia dalseonensis]|uniref:4-diphosphocytidyl-2-C-methyl-D-erythritol kinase n=1 Tax=Kaistia dalseonensis TaxID=410840 RepID=A0ABU0HCV6_9HYPH|nr:4-(cytidine 5'-diphospho)-2-C-methyl-D-erythritol kinase [Kaistia dalseonensis]MCX5497493.1 4-(cytidine 5'-diphospho)-2-C-methyl-D-erythritol kinase [Kaistia dalseonensis]MDQ0440132.1 4-diphosphocytidyl-2-C-methyl-D-erythritol kinase [Kaistia dalseonensis]
MIRDDREAAGQLGSAFAPAKLNLALHVVGQRADGYHLLDSLVVFADIGDRIEAFACRSGDGPTLEIAGPFAGQLSADSDNLVLKAWRALHDAAELPDCRLRLTKNLPIASGIGGGSADAAATLRLLAALASVAPPPSLMAEIAGRLGADVPMCLQGVALRARGIGADIEPLGGLPSLPMVLLNPGVAVPTPAVFRRLARRTNPPIAATLPGFADVDELAAWLATQTRNDLEMPAMEEAPIIRQALDAVSGTAQCRLARMSGSGATVFGIYPDSAAAAKAARELARAHPDWWVVATTANPQHAPA